MNQSLAYYGWFGGEEANLPVNYQLKGYNSGCDATCVRQLISSWLVTMPEDQTANWLVSWLHKLTDCTYTQCPHPASQFTCELTKLISPIDNKYYISHLQTDYQDLMRMPTIIDPTQLNCINMVKFTLPGSTLVMQGEEIGMVDGDMDPCAPPITGCDPAGQINPVCVDVDTSSG